MSEPTYTLRVREVIPWVAYNEYEAEVLGELDGLPICGRVVIPSDEARELFQRGAVLTIEAWFDPLEPIRLLAPETPPSFERIEGIAYEITGSVRAIDEEHLDLDGVLPMRVNYAMRHHPEGDKPLKVGDTVRLKGDLQLELP